MGRADRSLADFLRIMGSHWVTSPLVDLFKDPVEHTVPRFAASLCTNVLLFSVGKTMFFAPWLRNHSNTLGISHQGPAPEHKYGVEVVLYRLDRTHQFQ